MELSVPEKDLLISQARLALENACRGEMQPEGSLLDFPPGLQAPGASFVTLYKGNSLRGCVGSVEARRPLVEDVRENAVAAGFSDYRFSPLQEQELASLSLEISVLSPLQPLGKLQGELLVPKLRPALDGVLLKDGSLRGIFLPKVWQKLPEPDDFLSHLCQKMGLLPSYWKSMPLEVFIFQTQDFGRGL
jgi:hypothetical protein